MQQDCRPAIEGDALGAIIVWALFMILFFWTPLFLAIDWLWFL